MVEKTILDYLNSKLDVNVYMEEPEAPESSYVIIQKTGSSRINMIDTAVFAIQCYGKDMLEAATLNQTVKEALDGIEAYPEIVSCRLQTDYNFTDPTTMRYRYQALYNVVHY